jgi:hypothetical protein
MRGESVRFFEAVIVAGIALSAQAARAEPVVKSGGVPGAATSWTSKKDAVVLEIGETYDASEVANAIQAKVPGAQAKARGTSVIVTGVAESKLLESLAKIDVAPSMDDIDEMLTSMQKPGGDEEGSGSSIRATQAADFSEVLGNDAELISAKVVEVEHHNFPVVIVKVQLTAVPKTVKTVKKGQKIALIPRVKSRDGVVDPNDKASKLNVGAWYAVKGDTVRVRLEGDKPQKDDVWVAAAFQRMK